jgi:hypothetical protein
MQSLNEEIYSENKLEDEDHYRYAMKVLNTAPSDNFKLRSRKEYEKLINSKLYTKAAIRIKFPNEVILQGTFGVMETIGDIIAFIRDNLGDQGLEFYLTTFPPLRKYLDPSATILSQNLAPSTLMYINFPKIDPKTNQSYNYIKLESIEKYERKINE